MPARTKRFELAEIEGPKMDFDDHIRRMVERATEQPRINTQVQSAVKSNDVRILKSVLFMAAEIPSFDLDGEDEDGITGLVEACLGGNAEFVRLLLEAGADPNAASSEGGRTPLLAACDFPRDDDVEEARSAECVRALLEDPRTDPTMRNDGRESALELAKRRGCTESVALVEKAVAVWEKRNEATKG